MSKNLFKNLQRKQINKQFSSLPYIAIYSTLSLTFSLNLSTCLFFSLTIFLSAPRSLTCTGSAKWLRSFSAILVALRAVTPTGARPLPACAHAPSGDRWSIVPRRARGVLLLATPSPRSPPSITWSLLKFRGDHRTTQHDCTLCCFALSTATFPPSAILLHSSLPPESYLYPLPSVICVQSGRRRDTAPWLFVRVSRGAALEEASSLPLATGSAKGGYSRRRRPELCKGSWWLFFYSVWICVHACVYMCELACLGVYVCDFTSLVL